MEHIWIGKYYPGSFPYLRSFISWGITIKGGKFVYPEQVGTK
ncbi:hypothetical protein ES708_15459 [subsurface metagenome]